MAFGSASVPQVQLSAPPRAVASAARPPLVSAHPSVPESEWTVVRVILRCESVNLVRIRPNRDSNTRT